MSFQILNWWLVQRVLVASICLQEWVWDVCAVTHALYTKSVCKIVGWLPVSRTVLLYARDVATGQDITANMMSWFIMDRVQSPASLCRWLVRFGMDTELVYVVYKIDDATYHAVMDLDACSWSMSGFSVDMDGLALHDFPTSKNFATI